MHSFSACFYFLKFLFISYVVKAFKVVASITGKFGWYPQLFAVLFFLMLITLGGHQQSTTSIAIN